MSTTIAISPKKLQEIIQNAVNQAFDRRLDALREELDEQREEAALLRIMESRSSGKTVSMKEFKARMAANS
jgi:hypothetical protein